MPESVQSCFELSIHLSVKRTSRELLLKIVRGKKIQGNVCYPTAAKPANSGIVFSTYPDKRYKETKIQISRKKKETSLF